MWCNRDYHKGNALQSWRYCKEDARNKKNRQTALYHRCIWRCRTCTGNCTVCDSNVKLGNDLSKFTINGIECEPIGLDSAYQCGNVGSQLSYVENKYVVSTANAFSYSFVVNEENEIVNELYNLARYENINPNKIYIITEEFTSYGITKSKTYKAKIMKATCNSNVGDVMQITIDFLRGDY